MAFLLAAPALPIGGVIGVIWYFFFYKNDNIITGLYLSKYKVDRRNPLQLIEIEGRKAGIVGWVLSLVRVSTSYKIRVSEREVVIESKAPFNEGKTILPISKVITTIYGRQRSRIAFAITVIFALIGIISLFPQEPSVANNFDPPGFFSRFGIMVIWGLLAAAVFFFGYLRNQTVAVRFSTGDTKFWGYTFLYDGEASLEKAAETVEILNQLIYDGSVNEDEFMDTKAKNTIDLNDSILT